MLRLRSQLPLLVVPLLLAAPVGAACDSGASLLLVPEDCGSVKDAVAAIASGGTIDVASGTATLGASPLSLSNLGKALTIRARGGAGSTTFSGGGTSPIVRIENSSAGNGKPIVFEGIRFADGRSTFANRAGGVTLVKTKVTFVDCRFESNAHVETTTGGGALAVLDGATAYVIRTRFSGNSARNNGGAIYVVRNPGWSVPEVWVHDSEFLDNTTALASSTETAAGGAIYVRDATLRVADSGFERNVSGWLGGAIYAFGNWAGGDSCDFTGAPTADALVTRSQFLENRADDSANPSAHQTVGGALHVERCARARIWSSLLEGNRADWGAGIYVDGSRLEIEQSIFRHNEATVPGLEGVWAFGAAVTVVPSGDASPPPLGPIVIDRTFFEGGTTENPDAATANFGGCMLLSGKSSQRLIATIRDSVFYGCHAGVMTSGTGLVVGGALDAHRTDLTVQDSLFLGNSTSGPTGGHAAGAVAVRLGSTGAFTNVVMADNESAFEKDLLVDTGDSSVSSSPEQWSEGSPPPTAGMLVAAPSRAAAGGPFPGEARIVWVWRGSSATLDGDSLPGSPKRGWRLEDPGDHTLQVSGLAGCGRCTEAVVNPVLPTTTLVGAPIELANGQSSTIDWTTSVGTFAAGFVDRGLIGAGASGSTGTGSLSGSTTYRRVAVTREGGAYAEVRVFVDEPALEPLFADDFDLGDLAAWSSSVGG